MFLISCIISFAVSALLIPVLILFCNRYKLYDPVTARKIHSGNIARVGGIAIFAGFILGNLISSQIFREISGYRLLPLFISGLLIFCAGLLDDIVNLRAIVKLIIQIIAAVIVIIGGYHFEAILRFPLPLPISYLMTLFWIIGIINAFNLIDGLDGLCGGISFLSFISFALIFMHIRDQNAGVCFIAAAAIFGFLLYNKPDAKIFMGDCGSQFLGFMVSVVPLYLSEVNLEYIKIPSMLVITALPMLDMIAAIWRRLREHRSIMSPDRAHIHHKLLNIGFSKRQVLFILLSIHFLACMSVVLAYYISRSKGVILLGTVYLFLILFYFVIHYANRAICKKTK